MTSDRPGGPDAALAPPVEQPYIRCDDVFKIYKSEELEVVALRGLDLEVYRGEMMALVGASGSGKSTLLNILAGLDQPSAGRVEVGGRDLLTTPAEELVDYRRAEVGFVWQQTGRNLIPYLGARANVEMPLMIEGASRGEARERATDLLERVGLADKARNRPDQLSGGEQQRVAIAVALANNPPLLLADEPTGELDNATAGEVFDVFAQLNEQTGVTIVIVTHDASIIDRVHRVVAFRDGKTSAEIVRRTRFSREERSDVDEYAVVDRSGRLQVPREIADALGLGRRARVSLVGDHIEVRTDQSASAGPPPRAPSNVPPPAPPSAPAAGGAMSTPLVDVREVNRSFRGAGAVVHAVRDVTLQVRHGEFVALRGRSGSGKTTLLNLIAGLDRPEGGSVHLDGEEISSASEARLTELRRHSIGFVFQSFALLPLFSARENVELALRIAGVHGRAAAQRANEALDLVGLGPRADHRPYELSGGEQQRVAIARAIANQPAAADRRRADRRAGLGDRCADLRAAAGDYLRGHHRHRRHPRPADDRARRARAGDGGRRADRRDRPRRLGTARLALRPAPPRSSEPARLRVR